MKPHEEWLFKAGNDLESARVLLASNNNLFDTAIYHTQQCAEKSLKAFLAFHNQEITKTHDLKILLKKCCALDVSFESLITYANFLNPFVTFFDTRGLKSFPIKIRY